MGQTVNKRFRYYRCRRAYAGPKHDRCQSQYINADALEAAVLEQAAQLLSDPSIVIAEYERLKDNRDGHQQLQELKDHLDTLDNQKARLVKLYQLGEIDDDYLQQEFASLRAQHSVLQEKLRRVSPSRVPEMTEARLEAACAQVRCLLEQADDKLFPLVLEALDITVAADRDGGTLTGTIPEEYAQQCNDPDVCAVVRKSSLLEAPPPPTAVSAVVRK